MIITEKDSKKMLSDFQINQIALDFADDVYSMDFFDTAVLFACHYDFIVGLYDNSLITLKTMRKLIDDAVELLRNNAQYK